MEKVIKKGKWVLIHQRYLDEMGFEKDSFDLFDTEQRVHRPFRGKIKVSDKDEPINKINYDYTSQDYEEMLQEQIDKLN